MGTYLVAAPYDLVTPDGFIVKCTRTSPRTLEVHLRIENISPVFRGFSIDKEHVFFNLKSSLAQLGLNSRTKEIVLDSKHATADLRIMLDAYGEMGSCVLDVLDNGAHIGKLFAADPRRRVKYPDYLLRMFGRTDREGRPLLALGGPRGRDDLLLERIEGHTVAFLQLLTGVISYDVKAAFGLLPTIGRALRQPAFRVRNLVQLNQTSLPSAERKVAPNTMLLVHTVPLHIRTAYGKVVSSLLPPGFAHTTADVLEPDTTASGDVYELFGEAEEEIAVMPVEFYTLDPYREHVFFADRDQLQHSLEDPRSLFRAFDTAPKGPALRAATYVVKGEQLLNLNRQSWIAKQTEKAPLPGPFYPQQQALLAEKYIEQQPCYPFLKSIQDGLITSQGILLTRYFPSPFMKRLFLSDLVQRSLQAIYFQFPSLTHGNYFSHEDRSFLLDLAKFGISAYWVDLTSNAVLQYVPKPGKDTGMFVPLPLVDDFVRATIFGIYGSALVSGNFAKELSELLRGLQEMKATFNHPMLNSMTPLALVTGGGPGVMEVGNRVAKRLGILSCADIVEFSTSPRLNVKEQEENPYIEAKMTYRLDRLIERQAEFNLDFPIILPGGFGTDFEQSLEEVRRKTGAASPTPILLFGDKHYWKRKITARFTVNREIGTIAQSEWISNCFYCVQSAKQGLKVYRDYFAHTLPIGPAAPTSPDGFITVD